MATSHSQQQQGAAGTQAKAVTEMARTQMEQVRESISRYTREQPLNAVAKAAVIGCILPYLPVRSVISASLRLLIPGLCIFAAWKACESMDLDHGARK